MQTEGDGVTPVLVLKFVDDERSHGHRSGHLEAAPLPPETREALLEQWEQLHKGPRPAAKIIKWTPTPHEPAEVT
jgi:hypothetical protein